MSGASLAGVRRIPRRRRARHLSNVGAQSVRGSHWSAGRLLHVGDGPWRRHGLRAFDFLHHGLRLFRRRDGIEPSAAGKGLGVASVLYTFYPPLTASPWFYIGLVLVVAASWVWCVLMLVSMAAWKRENPGRPVPLAMFATTANAVLWLWTTVGMAVEVLYQVLPAAFGLVQTVDVGLSRTLFSWTLHAIVYFWLMPAYIAFYTMLPRAAGGRLYSDTMGRLTFIFFLIY